MSEMPETPELTRRAVQWTVPTNGEDHPIGTGPVLHVDPMPWGFGVRVWTEETDGTETRLARVVIDEEPIPEGYEHLGSTSKNGAWHLYGAPAIEESA